MKKCDKCGNMIQDNSLFCSFCGNEQIVQTMNAPSAPQNKGKVIAVLLLSCGVLIAGIILFMLLFNNNDSSEKSGVSKNGDSKESSIAKDNGLLNSYRDIALSEIEEFGELGFDEYNTSVELKGVFYISLIDIDLDGNDEMIIAHRDPNSTYFAGYVLEVWTYRNGNANCLYSGSIYVNEPEVGNIYVLETDGKRCFMLRDKAFIDIDLYTIENGEWTLYDTVKENTDIEEINTRTYRYKGEECSLIISKQLIYYIDSRYDRWKSDLEADYSIGCAKLELPNDNEMTDESNQPKIVDGKYVYTIYDGVEITLPLNIDDYVSVCDDGGMEINIGQAAEDLGWKRFPEDENKAYYINEYFYYEHNNGYIYYNFGDGYEDRISIINSDGSSTVEQNRYCNIWFADTLEFHNGRFESDQCEVEAEFERHYDQCCYYYKGTPYAMSRDDAIVALYMLSSAPDHYGEDPFTYVDGIFKDRKKISSILNTGENREYEFPLDTD